MKKEWELVLITVIINKTDEEIIRLNNLLNDTNSIDWVEIAGILMIHRLGGYFIKGLDDEQLKKIPKELKNSLQALVKGQSVNQEASNKYILELFEMIENKNINYAGLKGVIYGASIYDKGLRQSNDIDLLVYEKDLEKLDKIMREKGYIQSLLPNGNLIEATKKEKLIQRMNYHDLVPYVKQTNDGIFEIDINFLFDGKDNLVDFFVFKRGTRIYKSEQYSFRGLELESNLAFLFCHFYREATMDMWVNNKRNLVLYKIVDIVNFIRYYREKIEVEKLFEVFEEFNLLEKVTYSLFTIDKFYGDYDLIKSCLEYIRINYSDMWNKYNGNKIFEQYLKDAFNLWR